MASPLVFKGGFQLTEYNSVHTPLLRFRSDAPTIIADSNPPTVIFPAKLYFNNESASTILDSVLSNHISLQFGGHNLAFTGIYPVTGYKASRMMMMF